MTARLIACLLLAAPLLGGCLSDRTFGESLDDSSAATEIKTRLFGAGGFSRFGEVDVAVVDRFVLLSGRVPSDADRKEAERIAWQVASVDEVANELQIDKWDLGRDMNDTWITEQVRMRLLADNDIKGTNFNIQVHNGVVYLLGLARSEDELRKAAEHASLVNGVQKVVSYVKMRARQEAALESVTPQLRRRIEQAARIWTTSRHKLQNHVWRFDIVLLSPGRMPRHMRDAWRAEN